MRVTTVRRYWLPITLGGLGLLLLARVFLFDAFILVPEDIDVVVLVTLLAITLVAAVHSIVRVSMHYLRQLSVQRARRETLAEHSRFLQRLDHELKNPLTTLRTGLKTLSLTALDAPQRQMVETMEQETLRLSRLVTDLRKLVDLETQPLNLAPVNMEAFVADIMQIEQERFEAGERPLTASVAVEQNDWLADADLLALAVHNLLDNAFKYTRPGDSVRLEVSAQKELTIRVVDTGVGIPPDEIGHIWEELYRAQQTMKAPGSGIGLALVRAIVERHQGRVAVESDPGRETAVSLHLPPLLNS